ncbi:MAG: hypothetical protein BMS9Abin31_0492 [Gammaproteobacteria bacterium]|nr:MAG: hypothetical protein BMS9Abin31_0492 [Gammaproteobacteria bacterium]
MKKKALIILAIIALICISCTTATYERDVIKEVSPLKYRHIAKEDLVCLSDRIYFDIKYNDNLCVNRVRTLTNTIKAHNEDK